jgi:hypothetical protein
MDTQNDTTQTPRPFGYWIKAVDRLMAAEFATAFETEGASRRDWRLLNIVDGTVPSDRPLHPGKLRGLAERGWIARESDGWTLTDEGRAAKERLGAAVDGIRSTMTDAVDPDDLATTIATLEQIAKAYGWDENTPLPRGRGGHRHEGRGFGRRHGHPFGRRHGFAPDFGPDAEHRAHGDAERHSFGPRHGFAPGFRPGFGRGFGPGREFRGGFHPGSGPDAEHDAHCAEHGERGPGSRFAPEHGHGHHPGGPRAARAAQHAYERGFDAGYSRGRDA